VGGEAPVTPVSSLDSSFLTFPTNRAITLTSVLNERSTQCKAIDTNEVNVLSISHERESIHQYLSR
jgi:hypothetical protein